MNIPSTQNAAPTGRVLLRAQAQERRERIRIRAGFNGEAYLYEKPEPSRFARIFLKSRLLTEELKEERSSKGAIREVLSAIKITGNQHVSLADRVEYAATALANNIKFESCSIVIGSATASEAKTTYVRGIGLDNKYKQGKNTITVKITGSDFNEVIGTVTVEGKEGLPLSKHAKEIVEYFADEFGNAISQQKTMTRMRTREELSRLQVQAAMGRIVIPEELEKASQTTKQSWRFLEVARKAFNGKAAHIQGLFVFRVDYIKKSLITVLGMNIKNETITEPGSEWVKLDTDGTLPHAVKRASHHKSNMVIGIWNNGERAAYEFAEDGTCKEIERMKCDVPGFHKTLRIPEGERNHLAVIDFVFVNEQGVPEDVFAFYMKDATVQGTNIMKDGEVIVGLEKLGLLLDVCSSGGKSVSDAIKLDLLGIDGLTGLFTHDRIMEELEGMANEWHRSKAGIAAPLVGMVDIDHFKDVNTAYGHDVGDQVLREVAARLRNITREVDKGGRPGGEEFLLGFFNCEDIKATAEKIRKAFADEPIHVRLNNGTERDLTITVSIGLARFGEGERAQSMADTIVFADNALMFDAKVNGRNRYAIANDDTPDKAA